MTTITKGLLGVAVAGLVLGLALSIGVFGHLNSDVQYVVLPVGAIFAGLFLISMMLEKESARYDQEHDFHATTDKQSSATPGGPKAHA